MELLDRDMRRSEWSETPNTIRVNGRTYLKVRREPAWRAWIVEPATGDGAICWAVRRAVDWMKFRLQALLIDLFAVGTIEIDDRVELVTWRTYWRYICSLTVRPSTMARRLGHRRKLECHNEYERGHIDGYQAGWKARNDRLLADTEAFFSERREAVTA